MIRIKISVTDLEGHLTILDAFVTHFKQQPLHRVHDGSLFGCHGEEGGIKVADVLLKKVPMLRTDSAFSVWIRVVPLFAIPSIAGNWTVTGLDLADHIP